MFLPFVQTFQSLDTLGTTVPLMVRKIPMHEQTTLQEVLNAEAAWAEAYRNLDLDCIDQLMADDYTIIQPGGTVLGKAETMASLRSDQRHWELAASDEHNVRIYGDTAVVIGRWRGRGVNHGQAFDYAARYLCVWVKRDGRWQMVADQSTEIA
jgi:ketosteroid isomerase-like protein